MKCIVLLMTVTFLGSLTPSPSVNVNQFAGKWVNADPNTRGLASLRIEIRGKRLRIQAWGKCHPTDCAWGSAVGTVHAARVDASSIENAEAISTFYITSFSETILIIRPLDGDRLQVESFTKFTDESSRADYTRVEIMNRAQSGL